MAATLLNPNNAINTYMSKTFEIVGFPKSFDEHNSVPRNWSSRSSSQVRKSALHVQLMANVFSRVEDDDVLPTVSANQVKLKMLAAPINPADLNIVSPLCRTSVRLLK